MLSLGPIREGWLQLSDRQGAAGVNFAFCLAFNDVVVIFGPFFHFERVAKAAPSPLLVVFPDALNLGLPCGPDFMISEALGKEMSRSGSNWLNDHIGKTQIRDRRLASQLDGCLREILKNIAETNFRDSCRITKPTKPRMHRNLRPRNRICVVFTT